ncbi:ATP-binding protein [Rhabdochromatium marinum]|uniref:ATP-binding protein n=1 Tax=Rhabdochromatium marinum TaxID=48729 RepID=UPI003B831DFB
MESVIGDAAITEPPPPPRPRPQPPGAPPRSPLFRPPPPSFRPPPPPRHEQLLARLRLLDAEQQLIAGHRIDAPAAAKEVLTPLTHDGLVVGWLGLSAPIWLENELAQRFYRQHNRSLLWISLVALTVALLLGTVFGAALLRRIRAVAEGARRLAQGNYQTRVRLKGRDELTGLGQDFNQLAVTLERSEALRRSAMADVSHELRTPLAVARAELDALIDGIRPCGKERLEQLQGRLLTLGRLLDDLYDLALSDSGALHYRFEPLDLSAILRATVADGEASCANRQLALHAQIDDGLRMEGDAGRLRQVLDNLLTNSLRYTDAGGLIRITATAAGGTLLIAIADTAPSVDPALLEHLFDRFYRVEASRSRAKGGAGLGLAICRTIVEAHGGCITARTADCGGLEIQLRFNLAQAQVRSGSRPRKRTG